MIDIGDHDFGLTNLNCPNGRLEPHYVRSLSWTLANPARETIQPALTSTSCPNNEMHNYKSTFAVGKRI